MDQGHVVDHALVGAIEAFRKSYTVDFTKREVEPSYCSDYPGAFTADEDRQSRTTQPGVFIGDVPSSGAEEVEPRAKLLAC